MSQYSYYSILKRQAKVYSKTNNLPLSHVHSLAAKSIGFSGYHELVKVADANPDDARLMALAFSLSDLGDAIYENSVWGTLDYEIENEMSGALAETNATMFMMANMEVLSAEYDSSNGHLSLKVNFDYQGDQDPERPWSGSEFNIDAEVVLAYRGGGWVLHNEDGLKITSYESDWDRDHGGDL